jgi:hypothetical protein
MPSMSVSKEARTARVCAISAAVCFVCPAAGRGAALVVLVGGAGAGIVSCCVAAGAGFGVDVRGLVVGAFDCVALEVAALCAKAVAESAKASDATDKVWRIMTIPPTKKTRRCGQPSSRTRAARRSEI